MSKIKGYMLPVLIIVSGLFFSCALDTDGSDGASYRKSGTPITSITDSRLNGSFMFYTSWKTASSRKYISDTYRFNGTDNVYNHYKSGYTSGYDTTEYTFNYEFEIDSGRYRKKLYHNQYDDWGEWKDIYFSDDETHLFIEGRWADKI